MKNPFQFFLNYGDNHSQNSVLSYSYSVLPYLYPVLSYLYSVSSYLYLVSSYLYSVILYLHSVSTYIQSSYLHSVISYLYSVTLFIFSHHYIFSGTLFMFSIIFIQSHLIHIQSDLTCIQSNLRFIQYHYIFSQLFSEAATGEEDSTQVFSCEYCEIFNNTYYEEHLRTAGVLKQHVVSKFFWFPSITQLILEIWQHFFNVNDTSKRIPGSLFTLENGVHLLQTEK